MQSLERVRGPGWCYLLSQAEMGYYKTQRLVRELQDNLVRAMKFDAIEISKQQFEKNHFAPRSICKTATIIMYKTFQIKNEKDLKRV